MVCISNTVEERLTRSRIGVHSALNGTAMSHIVERTRGGTLGKAVTILRLVASERGVSLSGIVRNVGLPKSTCHRLLCTLEHLGFVQGCAGANGLGFVLGPLIGDLAGGFANRQRIAQIARPIMERLRDRTSVTVLLHLFDGSARVVVAQVESLQELRRTYTNLGVRVPIYGGAASKLYLASLREVDVQRYWATFPRLVTQPDKPGGFKRFRRRGYAITFAELTPGVASIAMGVPSTDGRIICCLSVTGPLSRLSERVLKRFVPHLATSVSELARAIKGESQTPQVRQILSRTNAIAMA